MFRPVLRRAGSGALPNRIQHGTEADPDRPEVGDLIHLDQAVHLARASQDFPHLVGTDRIQAASEGGELQHFKMRGMGNHLGYGENPVRISPLGQNAAFLQRMIRGQRHSRFRNDIDTEPRKEFRQAVVDQRVPVIRSA